MQTPSLSSADACTPPPTGTVPAARTSLSLTSISVQTPDLRDLAGACVTGYYVNNYPGGDGLIYAFGRYDDGYFMCDEIGWGGWSTFSAFATALKNVGGAA